MLHSGGITFNNTFDNTLNNKSDKENSLNKPHLPALAYALCAGLIAAISAVACMAEEYDLAIRNVTVVDAVSGARSGRSVYVSGGSIRRIAAADASFRAAEVIDGQGKFLIPGLWDMHVHIVYEAALIERMPDLFLDYGVTSVRDTGALLHVITPQIKRWRALGAAAPDLYFSGPLLDGRLVVYDGKGRPEIGIANPSVEAALANFKQLQQAGVDFIKIYELVSPPVFSALAAAARQAGLPVAAHVPLSMRADTAGPRVNSMEHLRNVEITCADEADGLHRARAGLIIEPGGRSGFELRRHLHNIQRTEALTTADADSAHCRKVIRTLKQTIQVPTLRLNTITRYSPAARADWTRHLARLPEPLADQWLQTAEFFAAQPSTLGAGLSDWSLALVRAMHQEGVPIGAGTDTPIGQAIPGYSLHTELERLVTAGLTPRQALYAGTVTPAGFFALQDRMGQVQAGMEADLVLLHGNPLLDIRATRNIAAVISDGVRVR